MSAIAATLARPFRLRQGLFGPVSLLAASALVGLILYPLVLIILGAFGLRRSSPAAGEMLSVATSPAAIDVLLSTLSVVAPATIGAMGIAAVLAWLNERTDARLGWVADVMPVLPMFVPPIAGAIGWVFLGAPAAGLLNNTGRSLAGLVGIEIDYVFNVLSWNGLVFVYALYLTPFAYVTLAAGFRSIDTSLEEAAEVSGAGPWETMRRVTLPALGPSIGGAMLLVVAMGFALFSIPRVIGTPARVDVLSVEVVMAMTRTFPADTGTAYGYGLILVLLVGGAWVLQRRLSGGTSFATIGGRESRAHRVDLGRWRTPARLLMLGYLALTSLLPILGLLIVSLQGFWSGSINWGALSLDNYRALLERDLLFSSLRNSVVLGAAGATIGMLVAAIIAFVTLRRATRTSTFVDGVAKLPAAIPNIILALAFLVAFAGPPFRLGGTAAILLMGYVAIYFPHASVNANAAFLQVGSQLREAASVSGATDGRTFRRVLLPLMLPGLTAGWAFLFVLIAGDVNVSVLLASTRTPVAGFQILDLYANAVYPLVAALALVMTALSATVVITVLVLSKRRSAR